MYGIMRILEKSIRVSGGQSGIFVRPGAQKYCNSSYNTGMKKDRFRSGAIL
jgi:hypothetical protein